jgi:hypothetical protein
MLIEEGVPSVQRSFSVLWFFVCIVSGLVCCIDLLVGVAFCIVATGCAVVVCEL